MQDDSMGARLKAAREKHFTSARQAAEALGIKPSTYAAHENGANDYGPEHAKLYGKKFKVSPVHLLFGDEFAPQRKPLIETFDPDAPDQGEAADGMFTGSETGTQGIPRGTIPQIDVTAGLGGGGLTIIQDGVAGQHGMTFAAEAVKDFWRFPLALLSAAGVNPEDLAILPVQGDSMLPTLHDGEFVVVNTKHRLPSPDGIYALNDAFGGVVVKRLEVTSKPADEVQTLRVISDNPRHAPKEWNVEDLRIVGLVLWRFGYLQ